MTTQRILFMGTPEFAVPVLQALAAAAPAHNWQVVGVATQPDRPAGRGKQTVASPVKQAAEALGLPVLQPVSLRRDAQAAEQVRAFAPDLLVVAAYGLILPPQVLEIPLFGCINVHASLLPAFRGASPIAAAILDGLTETGVSIMLMDEGMDTGPVLAQRTCALHADDTTESLGARLATLGAEALLGTLDGWLAGDVAPVAQSDLPGEASTCRLIRKEDGRIDWSRPALTIERMTRAWTPWPGAWTTWQGQSLRILRARVVEGAAEAGLVMRREGLICVGTGAGLLALESVQPAGKRVMAARDFVNGAPAFVGARLE